MALTMRRALIALACLPLAALAQSPAKPSPWSQFADYTLTVKVPPKGDAGTWKFRAFADPADAMVDLDTPAAKGRTRGTLLLVGGRAIAAKGFVPEAGYELDPLDAAVANLKALTRLLDAAAPGGPAAVNGKQAVAARDDKSPISVSTPTASAIFHAPWALEGTVERLDAETVAFHLALEAPAGPNLAERLRWTFSGTASGSAKGRTLDEAMSLAGWTAYALGPPPGTKSSHAALRFGATRLPGPFATLADLRAALK